ncbi:hypothetical protein Tc00.1047053507237.30 [Trypanosoma cruzi]|uniref:Uncharacterized protein n=1 Tax=Trypanosoma cruzi (strain CL Brener) TaxID=353153 RepID=Q4DYY7_TRYCC|nr:hypothetical protein Tc00.1047053507237.30 [Trypanosoma cruzi]EAN97719.1 hypothetical protein Tc00.1047053507237.30 [Trypanosoma cruzi]|eukprot:XP_819570.1 hypothetical protein [Trypanosoma cruzi strain CL Brener]
MEEGEANRSGTQGSTACTYGESGTSCLHPSRRVRTRTRGGAAHTATQKQSSNKKRRSTHTTWIVGLREVQPIFITKQLVILLLLDTVIMKGELRKNRPYKSGKYSVANGPSCGLGQSKFPMRAFPQWMKRSLLWSVGDQQPVASLMRRWRKPLVHLEYPRLCFLRLLPAGMIGNFGGDLRARRLLGRRWRHCGIRM